MVELWWRPGDAIVALFVDRKASNLYNQYEMFLNTMVCKEL